MREIESPSQPWQGRILTTKLHPHLWSDWLSYFKLFLANEKLITYISIPTNILPQILNNSNINVKICKINDIIISDI